MTTPKFTEADINCLYEDEGGDLWRLVAYAAGPSARLQHVAAPRKLGRLPLEDRVGQVGAPIFDGFRKLVPQDNT